MTHSLRRKLLLAMSAFMFCGRALAAPPPPHKPDAADAVAGSYFGNVISDSKGSSRSDVTLTLTRVGPNKVAIASDYPRLPAVTVDVERAMNSIVQRTGDTAFVYDMGKHHLDVSFHNEVSWSGDRQ